MFHGGYHGGVLYFVTGGSPVNMPYEYVVAPYNDIEGTKALFAKHGDEVFATLVEPMQGSHGCLPGDVAFLKMLRDETKARGITLIFDEVMTSRLSPGGLQAKHGVMALRTELVPRAIDAVPGATWAVGGDTASNLDADRHHSQRLPWVIGSVVLMTMVIMGFVFRSLVIALTTAVMRSRG